MSARPRVLVVDDDADLRALIADFLGANGLDVGAAADGAEMDRAIATARPDLVVLDLMMPGEDGLSILRRLRQPGGPGVIMLSAMGDDTDRIIGLEVGADDYLPKPCNPRELLARVRAVLRRREEGGQPGGPARCFGDWTLDLVAREVRRPGMPAAALTDAEFRTLTAFLDRPQRVLSRDQLIDAGGRGADSDVFDRSIDVTVSRLRRKLGRDDPIRTVRNEGYMFTLSVSDRVTRARSLPILWQTLLLLLASLAVSQAVAIGLFLSLRPPRPDVNRLADVGYALRDLRDAHGRRDRAFVVRDQPLPPAPRAGMVSDAGFTRLLAARMGTDAARVRLYFEPDHRGGGAEEADDADGWTGATGRAAMPMRSGEPVFFDGVVAGVRTPDGWRVVATPPRPKLSAWQRRTLLWFGLSALALTPFAWLFARALTRPIRRFADAADRLGRDPMSPPVPAGGPAELRVAAHAINGMQARLGDYLAERTAMIGAIAHDLRTPLARIAFRIESAPDAVRDKVQADIEQMHAMIVATIGFVRGTTPGGAAREIELGVLLRRMVADACELGRDVGDAGIEALSVMGDPIALERLFQNLIDNAVSHGGGSRIAVSLAAGHGAAVARIADRGPGLPDDRIERMFQPFARGDPSRSRATGGIGLGLTIARAIAQEHGARLTLANRAGGGLEAEVRLAIA